MSEVTAPMSAHELEQLDYAVRYSTAALFSLKRNDIVALLNLVKELRAALPVADARNEGIEEAAKWHDVRAAQNESWADAAVLSDEGELRRRAADYRECAAAIRALKSPPAEGGK